MRFQVSPDDIKKANIPHEIFLTNLIVNHILMAVRAGGVAGTFPWVMAIIPLTSFALLGYILWRARRSLTLDPWYPMCHWQVCARRSRIFILMLILLLAIVLLLATRTPGPIHAPSAPTVYPLAEPAPDPT